MRVFIERRPVRRVWIKVHPNGQVVVVASPRYTERVLERLVERHRAWIERQRARYRAMDRVALGPGELLYRGQTYRFVLRRRLGDSVLFYPHRRIIASGVNLLASAVQRQWYMWEAERLVRRRARQLARRFSFTFARIEIRSYTSAWGYCSPDGVITFDWRIAMVPPSVMDYLIVHELVHTRIPSHGPRFWRKLETIYPAYREAVAWLNTYGRWL